MNKFNNLDLYKNSLKFVKNFVVNMEEEFQVVSIYVDDPSIISKGRKIAFNLAK